MTTGSALVWLAAVLAAGAVVAGGRPAGGRALWAAALASTGALIRLGWAFAAQDWTLRYVADNARSGVSGPLRVAGLWAGPEGSLLLWTALVAWAAVIAGRAVARSAPGPALAWARRLGGGLVAGYALVVAVTASPFERLDLPAVDGLGLQPVLEHPAMVWHPPILYAGLVGLLVPTVVAAARARAGLEPRVPVRLVAGPLALLTAGLLTGARWADVELGWGGYWAWDPIESAGLVAWCCGAVALHGVVVTPRGASGEGGEAVLAGRVAVAAGLAPGLAALWATTATRVGLVSSVHAFADRPGLRVGMLALAAVASLVAAAVVIAAAPPPVAGVPGGPVAVVAAGGIRAWWYGLGGERPWRRGAVAVLAMAALFVAVGAYEPLVEAGTTGDAVAIAGRYYSRLLWPVALAGMAVAVGSDLRSGGGRRWWPAALGGLVAVASTPWRAGPFGLLLAAGGGAMVGSALGRFSASGALPVRPPTHRMRGMGRALSHLGAGVLLVGVAGTTAGRVTTVAAPAGVAVRAGTVELVHQSIELVDGTATRAAVASVRVDGTTLHPGLVSYRLRGVSTAELAHRYRGFDELQVLLIDGDADSARYQVNELPRVGLVWLGGGVAAVGLALAAAGRRSRPAIDSGDGGRQK